MQQKYILLLTSLFLLFSINATLVKDPSEIKVEKVSNLAQRLIEVFMVNFRL